MTMIQAYIGTELKFAFTISAIGFSMQSDDFNILVTNGVRSIKIEKHDCIQDGGNWFFVFDSAEIGAGMVSAIVTAYVPDTNYPDGLRTEVEKVDLVYINSTETPRRRRMRI